jgi:amino acid transporter
MGDLLFSFTEWLRTTFMVDFALWLSDTWASVWLATHFWAIPNMQCIHILAISSAFGAILMVNLRIYRFAGTDRTMAETERRYVRWIWWSLLVLLLSGIGMTVAEPVRELVNPVFWVKMPLVVVAVLVSLWFHHRVMRRLAAGGTAGPVIKTAALLIIVLWCIIMLCGRWIAYAPV